MDAAEELRRQWPGDEAYVAQLAAIADDARERTRRLDTLAGYAGRNYRVHAAYNQAQRHLRATASAAWPGMPRWIMPAKARQLDDAHQRLEDGRLALERALQDLAQDLGEQHYGQDLDLDDLVADSDDLADPDCPPRGDELVAHLQQARTVLGKVAPDADQAKQLATNWEKAIRLMVLPDGNQKAELATAVDELAVHQLAAPLYARLAAVPQKAGG
jgi:hypothetical protein